MPLQATSGAASYDAFGGGVPVTINYIEDVFSTYLYTGNSTARSITNGIDLSTKGGLVWIKNREYAGTSNTLYDTLRGINKGLESNTTGAQVTGSNELTAFNVDGFSLGTSSTANWSPYNFVSWTFREQPKFFDVVTYTGTGSNTTIAHNLGSVPGCIIVKRTNTTADWAVYHRSLANTKYLVLNSTAAAATGATWWNSTTPTSAVFSVGTDASVNASGGAYVAYIFAHDAGGFGLTETDNVISCGSFTGTSKVTLGYEPQWLLIKKTSFTSDWYLMDTMRGLYSNAPPYSVDLSANTSNAEQTNGVATIDATGFTPDFGGDTSIYIAIRRGPMAIPTLGTTVYNAISRTGTGASANITGVGFPPDLLIDTQRAKTGDDRTFAFDRLRGPLLNLVTNETAAEVSTVQSLISYNMDGVTVEGSGRVNSGAGITYINWFFKRAPSVFDEVCYTVSGYAANNVAHNLTVTPELFITKPRGSTGGWTVYGSILGATTKYMTLNDTQAVQTSGGTVWGATSSTFSEPSTIQNGTYVCYLFATCAGVSKVGSYTGNGSTQTINCGFGAGGARFVIIKRTDATGDWYVYDTTRGMTVLTDPYLLLNSIAAEAATLGSVTTVSTGFALNATILAAINTNAASYIFLAIA